MSSVSRLSSASLVRTIVSNTSTSINNGNGLRPWSVVSRRRPLSTTPSTLFDIASTVRGIRAAQSLKSLIAGSNRFRGIYSSVSEEMDPRKLSEDEWLKKLSPEQYYVCREKGTEEPFSGKYYMHKEEGVYTCVCCGTELFSSKSKYDSGTGWPSFTECLSSINGDNQSHSNLLERSDNSKGTVRTEVLCKRCDGHLGHVFTDGPPPTGHRYCINSLALKFVPKKMP